MASRFSKPVMVSMLKRNSVSSASSALYDLSLASTYLDSAYSVSTMGAMM